MSATASEAPLTKPHSAGHKILHTDSAEYLKPLLHEFAESLELRPIFRGEISLYLRDAELIREVSLFLRDKLNYDYLLDISSVDHENEEPRFEIVYEHYSLQTKRHLRLSCRVSEEKSELHTISDIYPTANWHEREIYDMMGIKFIGHPDLRRILMWEGYPHFPLRKEFPLEGLPVHMPDGHFTDAAPMEGGPFVTSTSDFAHEAEPRSRTPH